MNTTKRCWRCKRTLPMSAFSKNRGKKDGHQAQCRRCMADMAVKARRKTPRTLRELEPNHAAWVAGMFEGEGSITSRGGAALILTLTSTDRDVLEQLVDWTGVGHIYEQRWKRQPEHWKPRWQWAVGAAAEVLHVVDAISPYLLARRSEQVSTALAAYHAAISARSAAREESFREAM